MLFSAKLQLLFTALQKRLHNAMLYRAPGLETCQKGHIISIFTNEKTPWEARAEVINHKEEEQRSQHRALRQTFLEWPP